MGSGGVIWCLVLGGGLCLLGEVGRGDVKGDRSREMMGKW